MSPHTDQTGQLWTIDTGIQLNIREASSYNVFIAYLAPNVVPLVEIELDANYIPVLSLNHPTSERFLYGFLPTTIQNHPSVNAEVIAVNSFWDTGAEGASGVEPGGYSGPAQIYSKGSNAADELWVAFQDGAPPGVTRRLIATLDRRTDGDMLKSDYDSDDDGFIDLAAGGLEADVSAYDGLVKVSGGATSQVTDNSSNWDTAYGWGDHSGLYLPIGGGTLTGTLYIPEYISHDGDTDTYLRFLDNNVVIAAEGSEVLSVTNGVATIDDVLKLTPRTTDPSTPSDGMMWVYQNGSVNELRIRLNGTTYSALLDLPSNDRSLLEFH